MICATDRQLSFRPLALGDWVEVVCLARGTVNRIISEAVDVC